MSQDQYIDELILHSQALRHAVTDCLNRSLALVARGRELSDQYEEIRQQFSLWLAVVNKHHAVIRVMIVDDHPEVRNSLRILLDVCDGMEFVGEACNGQEAIALCKQLKPNIVLMDLKMPVMDGVEATQIICRHNPSVQVIGLTHTIDGDEIEAFLKAGSVRCVSKYGTTIDDLETAIRSAFFGAALRKSA
jgi:CheY-like chemotaxis protein